MLWFVMGIYEVSYQAARRMSEDGGYSVIQTAPTAQGADGHEVFGYAARSFAVISRLRNYAASLTLLSMVNPSELHGKPVALI